MRFSCLQAAISLCSFQCRIKRNLNNKKNPSFPSTCRVIHVLRSSNRERPRAAFRGSQESWEETYINSCSAARPGSPLSADPSGSRDWAAAGGGAGAGGAAVS